MSVSYPGRIQPEDVGFCGGRKTEEPGEKPSRQSENNKNLSQHMAPSRNRTRVTLVERERSNCAIPAPHRNLTTMFIQQQR